MSNLRFQNAGRRISQATPPIWMMRQAGRYHQHYQKLRAKHSFMQLCKEPELAAEVAMGPIQDFDFDVAILFSDLLFPLEALGMGLEYTDHGPRLGFSLSNSRLSELRPLEAAIQDLQFQAVAMRLTRERLPQEKSLIGFVGGPWTLFVYAVEGGHSGSLIQSKTQPLLWKDFLKHLLPLLKKNIELQLEAGAETVMLFDTAAGEVSPLYFRAHLQESLVTLAKAFPGRLGYYSKGTQPAHFTDEFKNLWAGQGFDHRWNLTEQFESGKGFVQGNFDQSLLHCETQDFQKHLQNWLQAFRDLSPAERAGWVCGLGHGVLPKTPEKNVRLFVETVREVLR